ncbi:hypothetical protein GCM10017624_32740 [Azotobacter vinelandii]|nr:hypothetical protein GCM10017624_32740 [Azotobacter vinelandii]
MSRRQALAHHGKLLLDTPAATPLLAEHFDVSVFAGSHKHDRLPIPYGKRETVSGVSGGLVHKYATVVLMGTGYSDAIYGIWRRRQAKPLPEQ